MGKSRAEIQKAYRQRLKEKSNEEYLRKERERWRRNYVPANQLSERDRKRRNEKNREKLRKFYQRKREERRRQIPKDETSGYESEPSAGSSIERGRLRVRMQFQSNRRKGALLRWRRELSEAASRIRLLEQERSTLMKKYKSTCRSLQRMKKTKVTRKQTTPTNITPSKQTETQMLEADLSSPQKRKIRKTLLLGNVVLSEVKRTKEKTSRGTMKALHRVVSGNIVKKYKCVKLLSERTGMCRHRLGKSDSKKHQVVKVFRMNTVRRHQKKVEEFMRREDNSKLQPGKLDDKRISKDEKKQIYILTDYLSNLFVKFKSENPNLNISFTSFCRCRPKYIFLTAFSNRSSCLCTKHQNAALTVKMLRREGLNIPSNPEKLIETLPLPEDLKKTLPQTINWSQWTRVEIEEKGKKKYVTKVVESKLDKEEFLTRLEKQMVEFAGHVRRVVKQYEEIKTLKENLPEHEMILQLDFAENYSCRSMEEVQSAYFNQTSVTLHPTVVYFRGKDGSLLHKSFIIVSDEMGHKASTVIAFIDETIPMLKEIDINLKRIHYWSDSPTSQYRNKHIFDLVSNHEEKYGIKARWNYFEAGHGKGPCDGLGGTAKRLADEAMRSGKVIIQDAVDFFNWGIKSSMINVIFKFVPASKCKKIEEQLQTSKVKPVKGTMKIHAIIGLGKSHIRTREVSCYCGICLSGQVCEQWSDEITTVQDTNNEQGGREGREEESVQASSSSVQETFDFNKSTDQNCSRYTTNNEVGEVKYSVGEYVAAIYEGAWYIGKVTDQDDDEYEIKFMRAKKQFFQWPRYEDIVWMRPIEILTDISPPEATGKSRRMYKISDIDRTKILQCYESHK